MKIKPFTFNAFQVKTYLLYDDTKEGVVIDAGMNSSEENSIFDTFVEKNGLVLKHHLLTHAHIDHVLGSAHIRDRYGLLPEMHKDGLLFLQTMEHFIDLYGLNPVETVYPSQYLTEKDTIPFGDTVLEILYTPGHAAGSLCYLNKPDKVIFTGDVLFKESIGRTDLPTGDFDLLMKSIKEKIFTLPGDFKVYPGHGEPTTIAYEMAHNPFIM